MTLCNIDYTVLPICTPATELVISMVNEHDIESGRLFY